MACEKVELKCSAFHSPGSIKMDLSALTMYFNQYGAVAIFVIVFLEYLNMPGFPAGIIMPLAGVMAARGDIGFGWVMVITVAAGLLGSLLLYFMGLKGGGVFLRAYIRRFPKQEPALRRNMEWVKEKGCRGVFFAKLIPMVRTLVSIPAGVLQMPLDKYIVSSTLGIFVWNFVFVGAGYVLGDSVFELLERIG